MLEKLRIALAKLCILIAELIYPLLHTTTAHRDTTRDIHPTNNLMMDPQNQLRALTEEYQKLQDGKKNS